MTRDELLKLPTGALLLTPWEPRATVALVEVEHDTAMVRFTHDHGGYPKDSLGRYYIKELSVKESG